MNRWQDFVDRFSPISDAVIIVAIALTWRTFVSGILVGLLAATAVVKVATRRRRARAQETG